MTRIFGAFGAGARIALVPIHVFLPLLLSACATAHYHDRALNNPQYYEGTGIPVTDRFSVGSGAGGGTKLHTPPLNTGAGSATEAIIESGISLFAYPDYYKPSSISGTCYFGSSILEHVPCHHVRVVLLDENLKAIGNTDTNDAGEFAFFVKKDKLYFLVLDDPRFTLAGTDRLGPFTMGAKIIMNGERKATATEPTHR